MSLVKGNELNMFLIPEMLWLLSTQSSTFRKRGKKKKSEARSKISRSRKTENPVYPEHTPNKADTK